jgi:hypothetical protein
MVWSEPVIPERTFNRTTVRGANLSGSLRDEDSSVVEDGDARGPPGTTTRLHGVSNHAYSTRPA